MYDTDLDYLDEVDFAEATGTEIAGPRPGAGAPEAWREWKESLQTALTEYRPQRETAFLVQAVAGLVRSSESRILCRSKMWIETEYLPQIEGALSEESEQLREQVRSLEDKIGRLTEIVEMLANNAGA